MCQIFCCVGQGSAKAAQLCSLPHHHPPPYRMAVKQMAKRRVFMVCPFMWMRSRSVWSAVGL